MSAAVEFRVLGPLELWVGHERVHVAAAKQRAVLAVLVLHANVPVALRSLLQQVWEVEPPPTAKAVVRNHVSALRKLLHDAPGTTVDTVEQGYVLRTPPSTIDGEVFRDLGQRGRRELAAGDGHAAAALLDRALALWRGPVLADLVDAGTAWPEIAELEELRLQVVEDRNDVDLALGDHRRLVPRLERQVREHPGRETLYRQQMTALYGDGQQARALAAYEDGRAHLRDHAGRRPGGTLQELHQAILEQREDLDRAVAARRAPLPVPGVGADSPHRAPSTSTAREGPAELRRVTVLHLRIDPQGIDPQRSGGRVPPAADPEVEEVMSRVLAEVTRCGGRVEQTLGSTALVLFGASRAHEQDVERAVLGALAARDVAGRGDEQVAVAASVAVGAVLVRPARAGGRTSVVGRVLEECAQMLRATPPGVVRVSGLAHLATHRSIRYVRAEGSTWFAVPPSGDHRLEVTDRPGRFVGRDVELRHLSSWLRAVAEQRHARLLTVVGPAGIGKSRLVREALRRHELAGGGLVQHWLRPPALQERTPLTLWEHGDGGGAACGSSPVLEELRVLAESMGGGGVGGAVDAAPTRPGAVGGLTADGPLVVVFEDLHRGDEALLDLVGALATVLGPVPLLVVALGRPELHARRPAWGGGQRDALTVTLGPLSASDSEALLSTLVPDRLDGLRAELDVLVGGNPRFAVEYARLLDDLDHGLVGRTGAAGPAAVPVPAAVAGIVSAGLDALEPDHRSILLAAAVLAAEFRVDDVAAVSGEDRVAVAGRLVDLERRDVLHRTAGGRGWGFTQVQVRDAVLQRMPRAVRVALQDRVAQLGG